MVRVAITIFRFFRSAGSKATTPDFSELVGASDIAIPPSRAVAAATKVPGIWCWPYHQIDDPRHGTGLLS